MSSPEMNTINSKVQSAEIGTVHKANAVLTFKSSAAYSFQNQSSVRTRAFALGYDRVLDVDPGAPLRNPFLRAVPSQ